MTAEELKQFEALPTCAAAVAVREYDDRAKIVGQPTPTYADFRHYLVTTLKATHHANASQQ
jgi:predicted HD phosphohydrolase